MKTGRAMDGVGGQGPAGEGQDEDAAAVPLAGVPPPPPGTGAVGQDVPGKEPANNGYGGETV